MKHTIRIAIVIAGFFACNAQADVSLTLELGGPDMEARTKKVSVARFFVRVDDATEPERFLLFQTGKFFPLYQIDKTSETYTLLTPEVKPTLHAGNKAEPMSAKTAGGPSVTAESTKKTDGVTAPTDGTEQKAQTTEKSDTEDTVEKPAQTPSETKLRLTKKKKTIAEIHCRVVEEVLGDQTVMTHCMADKARLGITEREIRSLARLFKMARERDFGWLGTYTKDEDFVSIASEDLQSKHTLRLTAFDTKPLPAGYLRIPKHYKLISKK